MAERKSAEWYDFVPLPEGGKKPLRDRAGITHAQHLTSEYVTGHFDLTLMALSPIHVGSGIVERSEDAGQEAGSIVKGMARVDGRPVIPASSLKGALRSNYETITWSCLGQVRTGADERYSRDPLRSELPQAVIDKLPEDLQRRAAQPGRPPRIGVELDSAAYRAWRPCRLAKKDDPTAPLCPACALFGTEGLQGRVWFEDAQVERLAPRESLHIASLYGPRLHRAGTSEVVQRGRRAVVRVNQLNGRKAYYRVQYGDVPADGNVPLDYLPERTILSTRLHFRNVRPVELGGVLSALGLVPGRDFPFRVGGGKPLGMGYLQVALLGIYVMDGASQWLDLDAQPAAKEQETFESWVVAFAHDNSLCYTKGWQQLCAITGRPYVPAEGE